MQFTKQFFLTAICFASIGFFGETLKAETFYRFGSGTYDNPYRILFFYEDDSGFFSERGQTELDPPGVGGVYHHEFKQKCKYHDFELWGVEPNSHLLEKNYSGWDVTETEDSTINSAGIRTAYNYVQVNKTFVNVPGAAGVRDREDELRKILIIIGRIYDAGTLTEQVVIGAVAAAEKPLAENRSASTIQAWLDFVSTRNGYGPNLNPLYNYEIKIRRCLGGGNVFEGTATNDSPQMASDPMAVSLLASTDLDEELVRDWPLSYVLLKQNDYQTAIFPKILKISSFWSLDQLRYYFVWPDLPRA